MELSSSSRRFEYSSWLIPESVQEWLQLLVVCCCNCCSSHGCSEISRLTEPAFECTSCMPKECGFISLAFTSRSLSAAQNTCSKGDCMLSDSAAWYVPDCPAANRLRWCRSRAQDCRQTAASMAAAQWKKKGNMPSSTSLDQTRFRKKACQNWAHQPSARSILPGSVQ